MLERQRLDIRPSAGNHHSHPGAVSAAADTAGQACHQLPAAAAAAASASAAAASAAGCCEQHWLLPKNSCSVVEKTS